MLSKGAQNIIQKIGLPAKNCPITVNLMQDMLEKEWYKACESNQSIFVWI